MHEHSHRVVCVHPTHGPGQFRTSLLPEAQASIRPLLDARGTFPTHVHKEWVWGWEGRKLASKGQRSCLRPIKTPESNDPQGSTTL